MLDFLPTLNALLNSTSAVLLFVGHRFIHRGNTQAHRRCMTGAVCTSVLFLISYLTYHYYHGTTSFPGEGWIRPVYFTILTSHTILAAAIVPLVIVTFRRGLLELFDTHKRIARWTYPLWLYVSVTGVIIYVMLYHLYPSQ
jgi:putative membrane protein